MFFAAMQNRPTGIVNVPRKLFVAKCLAEPFWVNIGLNRHLLGRYLTARDYGHIFLGL